MKPSPIVTTISSAHFGRMPLSPRMRAAGCPRATTARGPQKVDALPAVLLGSSASAVCAAIWRRRQGGLHHAN